MAYSGEQIKTVQDELNTIHMLAKSTLDASKANEGGQMTAEQQVEYDLTMDNFDRAREKMTRMEDSNERDEYLAKMVDDPLQVQQQEEDELKDVEIKIDDRVLTPYERGLYKSLTDFKAYAPFEPQLYKAYGEAMSVYMRRLTHEKMPEEIMKALSVGSGPAGGYLVQDTFMNALLVKSRDVSAMRRICRVLPPLPSGSIIWPAEDSVMSDATWTTEILTGDLDVVEPFAAGSLTPKPLAKRVKVSNTLRRLPTFDIDAYVRERMAYKFGRAGENAYINGNAGNCPTGLLTNTDIPKWEPTVANSVTADDVINWVYSLGAAYASSPTTRILCNRAFLRKIRTLKLGTGSYVWQPGLQVGMPDRILDTQYELSDLYDDALDGADDWETDGIAAIIGDFNFYWIVDAMNMTIQVLTELYAEANQTGYIGRLESDGRCVLPEAFYKLEIS